MLKIKIGRALFENYRKRIATRNKRSGIAFIRKSNKQKPSGIKSINPF